MTAPTPYDEPKSLMERFIFPSLRNAYLEGIGAAEIARRGGSVKIEMTLPRDKA